MAASRRSTTSDQADDTSPPKPCVYCRHQTTKRLRSLPGVSPILEAPFCHSHECWGRFTRRFVEKMQAQQRPVSVRPPRHTRCIVCAEPAEALDKIGRCVTCAHLSVADANRKIQERRLAREAALRAQMAAEERARLDAVRAVERDRFLALLDGATPPRALGDGTRATDSGASLSDASALAVFGVGTQALARLATPSDRVVETRRARRRAHEAACSAVSAAREALEKARAELDNDPHLQALFRQERALEQQAEANRRYLTATDPDIGTLRVPMDADGEESTLQPIVAALQATSAQLAPLRDKIERLEKELRAAKSEMYTTVDDYERWLDIEQQHRIDQILDKASSFTRACGTCGHEVPLALGKEFCGDECRSKYRRFDGEWFPQCATCARYFVADGQGGADAVRPLPDRDEDRRFCSPRCLLAAVVDLDDWPSVDAPCWQDVLYVPRPPLTAVQRANEVRRKILSQFAQHGRSRLRRERPGPTRELASTASDVSLTLCRRALPPSDPRARVLEVLRAVSTPPTTDEMVDAAALRRETVLTVLAGLMKEGLVVRSGQGRPYNPFRFSLAGAGAP